MVAKELRPLNIDTSKAEPTVEINKKIFDRLRWLYAHGRTVDDVEELNSLIHLILHTHEESEATDVDQ